MAAIRFPLGGGRYRGTPQNKSPTKRQNVMVVKILDAALMFLATVFVSALIGILLLYFSWNHGIVRVFDVKQISLGTAYWLSLFLSTVATFFKFSVKTG